MKLYHFLSEEYGLQAVRNQRIKVSHLDNLNDPFELFATNLVDHKLRVDFYSLERQIINTFGMLCFSQQWRSPLLWSHYADRHKGVALEMEVPEERVKKIKYQNNRIELGPSQLFAWLTNIVEVQERLLTTKYSQWSYEDEVRMFLSQKEIYRIGKLSFYDFNEDCKLVGVISGPLCKLSDVDIKKVLPSGQSIKFMKARLAVGSYDVVRNRNYLPRIVKGQARKRKRRGPVSADSLLALLTSN